MMSHSALQDACRAKLATLLVCTTGAITLSATTTGYARTAGSFLADGLRKGMELVPAGFTANPTDTIVDVTALTLTTRNTRSAQAAASGRSLTVSLPALVALENESLGDTDPLRPYWEEQYLPGPMTQRTNGPHGFITMEPQYSPRIFVPKNTGKDAAAAYADAITLLFCPNTVLSLPTGTSADTLRVRDDAGPYRSQLLQNAKGTHAVIVTTVPLRCFTTNAI